MKPEDFSGPIWDNDEMIRMTALAHTNGYSEAKNFALTGMATCIKEINIIAAKNQGDVDTILKALIDNLKAYAEELAVSESKDADTFYQKAVEKAAAQCHTK